MLIARQRNSPRCIVRLQRNGSSDLLRFCCLLRWRSLGLRSGSFSVSKNPRCAAWIAPFNLQQQSMTTSASAGCQCGQNGSGGKPGLPPPLLHARGPRACSGARPHPGQCALGESVRRLRSSRRCRRCLLALALLVQRYAEQRLHALRCGDMRQSRQRTARLHSGHEQVHCETCMRDSCLLAKRTATATAATEPRLLSEQKPDSTIRRCPSCPLPPPSPSPAPFPRAISHAASPPLPASPPPLLHYHVLAFPMSLRSPACTASRIIRGSPGKQWWLLQ